MGWRVAGRGRAENCSAGDGHESFMRWKEGLARLLLLLLLLLPLLLLPPTCQRGGVTS